MYFDRLEKGNIQIFPLDCSYVDDIYRENEGNVRKYFIPFQTGQEVENWVSEMIDLMKKGEKLETVVLSREYEFLGMIALDNLKSETTEVRLWIKEEAQGKGVGKKSLSLLLDWYKNKFPRREVVYKADADNEASIQLAESVGFKLNKWNKHNKKFIL